MPSARQTHDHFTDTALRPTTSNATSLRTQTSQQSLASNASTRTRPQRELFAPAISRRGATPRFGDDVLADSDSEQDLPAQRQQQTRRARHGSPNARYGRSKVKHDEALDFVNRKADGSYLLGVAGFGDTVAVPQLTLPQSEEEREQDEMDAHYVAISRQYFATGASLSTKSSKKHEDELEQLRMPMMIRLREKVMQQLEDERWKYEATR